MSTSRSQPRTGMSHRPGRRSLVCTLIVLNCLLQAFLVPPATAHIDFLTKLKLLGLLAIAKKIQIVPIPMPIPVPIHIEGKEEVLYMKAPAPAYSYAPSTHEYEYASPNEQYGGKGGGYQSSKGGYHKYEGNYYGNTGTSAAYDGQDAGAHQTSGDYSGHASEVVPVATSLRYGERLSSIGGSSRPTPGATPSARPNRVRQVGRGQPAAVSRNPAQQQPQQQFVPSSTPAPVVVNSQPLENDYNSASYLQPSSNYDQSAVSAPEGEVPVKIALIPFKSLDLSSFEQPQQPVPAAAVSNESQPNLQASSQPPINSQQHSLPENLLNYIREVHRTLPEGKSQRQVENVEKPKPVVTESFDKPTVVETSKPKETSSVRPTKPSQTVSFVQPTPVVVPTSTQYQSIQSNWLASPQHQQQQVQTFPYPGGYRAPELKVIRTKYDPKQQQLQEEQWKHQQPQTANKAQQHHQQPVQFLYSVTHDSQPATPFYNTPLFANQAQTNYPVLDNFGLAQFQATQNQKQKTQNQISTLGYLTPAASFETSKWIEAPADLQDNSYGHRIPKYI